MKKTEKLKNLKNKKFELADQTKVSQLEPYINKVIKSLGFDEGLVTDESIIWDFLNISSKTERMKQVRKAKNILHISFDTGDYIWEVAERLKNYEQN